MSETQDIVEFDDDDIDMEQLIVLVEERQLLWDKSLDEYKDRNKNREAWKEICQALLPEFEKKSAKEKKKLGDSLIKKWRNVRDRWMKQIRKEKDSKKSGAGARKIKKYIYNEQLQFLNKVAHQNYTESSINAPEGGIPTETEDIDDTEMNIPPQPKKPKLTRKKQTKKDEFELNMLKTIEEPENKEEETYLGFFKSMIPTLKTFTSDQFVEFQIGVLAVLKNVKAQGTSQTPTNTYQQVHYHYPGSQPLNMDHPQQQQPQFPPQFSNQAYTNSAPFIHPIHTQASTSGQYYPRNHQIILESSSQQATPPPLSSTPHRSTSTAPLKCLLLGFRRRIK